MQGFRGDIQVLIIKTFLWVGFFVLIIIGIQKWMGNNLGEKLENQKLTAMTQSIIDDKTACKTPYEIYLASFEKHITPLPSPLLEEITKNFSCTQ